MPTRLAASRLLWIGALPVLLAAAAGAKAVRPKASAPLPPVPASRGDVYAVDNAHSFVEFSARLIGFNRVRGAFPDYTAHIFYDADSVTRSSVSVRIAVAGVSTNEPERDRHLESADFFDAARFPDIRFDSREIVAAAGGFAAIGDLVIRDVTRPVVIPFAITSPLGMDPFGNQRFAAAGHVTISRHDFGVLGPKFWNSAIGDSIGIEFEIGARRWNFDRLGWGSPQRQSIGERILRTIDSLGIKRALEDSRKLWVQAHADTTWNFGLFEYMKCAGRLGQHDRPREGADVLAQAIELLASTAGASDLAAVRCQRAELLRDAGDVRAARSELGLAVAADSASTHVRVLRHAFD